MLNPYLFYVPMMLAALVWNAVVCVVVFRRRRNWPWRLRYAHYEEKMGLINSRGRKRPAYDDYRQLLTALSRRPEQD